MKKLLSSLVIILIVLLIVWAVSGWYFGIKTEQEFKALLQNSSQLVGKRLFRAELLSYNKTASGAKAMLGISSDYSTLNERMGELQMDVKLLNGPLFITRSGVSIGRSRWELNLSKTTGFKDFFVNSLPSATVQIDFEQKAHYVVRAETDFAQSLITGIFDLNTHDNRGAITLNNFNFGIVPNIISADEINISYQHQKAITTRYKPGTASLQVSPLKFNHKALSRPLVLDVKMNSDVSFDENALSGFVKADIYNVSAKQFPVETAELSLQFNGLPADAFVAFSEANDDLDNLHQQAQWVLEELGEVPEGQDQIWLLYDRIDESSKALPDFLAGRTSVNDEQLIQLKATTHYNNASSQLEGNIQLESENAKLSSWLSLLDGEAQVELDEYLYKVIQKLLPITNPKFKLLLKNNKVLMIKNPKK